MKNGWKRVKNAWKRVEIDMKCWDGNQRVQLHDVPALTFARTGTVGVYPMDVVKALNQENKIMIVNCLKSKGSVASVNALRRLLPRKLPKKTVIDLLTELEKEHIIVTCTVDGTILPFDAHRRLVQRDQGAAPP